MTLTPDTLLPPASWVLLRQHLQRRLEAHARLRTVPLGPAMRLRFDDELTLRLALQDELLVDGTIHRARLDSFERALPRSGDWCATLLLAAPEAGAALPSPVVLAAAASQVHVQVGVERLAACADAESGGAATDRQPRALRFVLTPAMHDAIDAGASVALVCTHPRYFWRRRLPAATLRELRRGVGDHRAEAVDQPAPAAATPPAFAA